MKPLRDVIRGPRRVAICAAVSAARDTARRVDKLYTRDGFRVVAEPLVSPRGSVEGVRVCAVNHPSAPQTVDGLPQRIPAGAWSWDLNRKVLLPSDDALDVFCVPEDRRIPELFMVQWMSVMTPDLNACFAAMITPATGQHGDEMLEQWPVRRLDGALRDMLFAAHVTHTSADWQLSGIVCDITVGDEAALPDPTFAEMAIDAELSAQDGWYTAILDLQTMDLVRWLSTPPPAVSWWPTGDPDRDPAVHPDDGMEVARMVGEIAAGRAEGRLRVRATDGGWVWIEGTVALIPLDQTRGVHGALAKFQVLADDGNSDEGTTCG